MRSHSPPTSSSPGLVSYSDPRGSCCTHRTRRSVYWSAPERIVSTIAPVPMRELPTARRDLQRGWSVGGDGGQDRVGLRPTDERGRVAHPLLGLEQARLRQQAVD